MGGYLKTVGGGSRVSFFPQTLFFTTKKFLVVINRVLGGKKSICFGVFSFRGGGGGGIKKQLPKPYLSSCFSLQKTKKFCFFFLKGFTTLFYNTKINRCHWGIVNVIFSNSKNKLTKTPQHFRLRGPCVCWTQKDNSIFSPAAGKIRVCVWGVKMGAFPHE